MVLAVLGIKYLVRSREAKSSTCDICYKLFLTPTADNMQVCAQFSIETRSESKSLIESSPFPHF